MWVRAPDRVALGGERRLRTGRWRRRPMTRYFAVYVLPALVMGVAATVVRSLSLDSLTTGVLTIAIILGGVAWFVAALRIK
jgi:hypothetical protein